RPPHRVLLGLSPQAGETLLERLAIRTPDTRYSDEWCSLTRVYDKVFVKPYLGIAWLLKRDPLNGLMNLPALLSRIANKGLV
ncbi:NADH-quinone oxidoreductase subunit L, partial [Pantoea agglomerans]|nr:NADH-quinone oxidoreductase subunit L [Pantoea agglomerans]